MARHVLHVADNTSGGLGAFLASLIPLQLAAGDRVTLAASDSALLAGTPALERRRWTAGPRPDRRVPTETYRLRRIVRTVAPDVLHLHSDKAGLAGRLGGRLAAAVVFQPHAWSFQSAGRYLRPATAAWERVAAHATDAIVCVGSDELDLGRRAGLHARLVLIVNGVDLTRFDAADDTMRRDARRRLGLDGARPIAVSVGRLHRQKNQHLLLDAWPEITRRVPDAQLLLVGDGPDRTALETRAVSGVRIVGEVEDVVPWLAAADVVAQPSRWEGMSLAVLEAMAMARSVVATDVPGMREAVGDEAGAIVPADDASALAAAIVHRLAQPTVAADEGRAGRARTERRNDLRHQHDKLSSLYDDLLAGGPRGR